VKSCGIKDILFVLSEGFISPLLGIQSQNLVLLVQLSSILLFTRSFLLAVQSVLIGSSNMKVYALVNIIQQLTGFITIISFIYLNWTLYGPVIGLILATGIAGLLGFFYIRVKILKRIDDKQNINWKCLPKIIKKGFPFSLISVVGNIRYEVFILILTILGFYIEVSYLKVGLIISAVFYIITRPIGISLFPIFSKYSWISSEDRTILKEVFQYSIKFLTIFISPIISFCIVFSFSLIPLIFGVNYIDSIQFISVFLISFFPLALGLIALPLFLFSQGYPGLALLIQFTSFIVSSILSICFSIIMGSFGFVIGISIGPFLGLLLGILITNRKFGKELFSNIKDSILILVIANLLCGSLFIGFYFFNFIIVLNNTILKLLELGVFFLFFYFVFIVILIKLNLIRYKEMLFFIEEFNKIPILKKVLPTIINIGKKLWKRNDDS